MKQILFIFVILILKLTTSVCQGCNTFKCAADQAEAFLKKGIYKIALANLDDAEIYAVNRYEKDKVKALRNGIFDAIEKEKDEAQQKKKDIEEKTKQILEKSDTINSQKKRAEDSLKKLQATTDSLNSAQILLNIEKLRSNEALFKMQSAYTILTNFYIQEIDQHILNHEYDIAIEKCRKALELQIDTFNIEIRNRILNLAYWYTEIDKIDSAKQIISMISKINFSKNDYIDLPKLRFMIQELTPSKYFESLEENYYPKLVMVKGGDFQMGSNTDEDDEKFIHQVNVKDFYIGKFEVTVEQFRLFIENTKYKTDAEKEGWGYIWTGMTFDKRKGINWKCDVNGNYRPLSEYNHPVIHVSWNDAKAYSDWLSKRKRYRYRLPIEEEWEYVAIKGSKSGSKFNDLKELDDIAWYEGNSDGKTHKVGSKNANELGINDIIGNVWEWCENNYISYSGKLYPDSHMKADRGGSWYKNPQKYRLTDRYRYEANYRGTDLGFRIVREIK